MRKYWRLFASWWLQLQLLRLKYSSVSGVCWVRVCLASWLAEELLTSPLLETDAEPRQNNFQLNSDKVL